MIITKLDAARRQMDAAIGLYFDEGDEVSIHTLVGAARLLIANLSSAAKQETILEKFIRPEKLLEFEKAIRAPQNFLKHADKDPDATLDLDPHATELLLLIEVEAYRGLTGGITDAMNIFQTYAAATWGKQAFEAVPADVLAGMSEAAAGISKREFFQLCMAAITRRTMQ